MTLLHTRIRRAVIRVQQTLKKTKLILSSLVKLISETAKLGFTPEVTINEVNVRDVPGIPCRKEYTDIPSDKSVGFSAKKASLVNTSFDSLDARNAHAAFSEAPPSLT
ncbi:unnamed protein product [Didymodactylos carnosus]|uniref:Uncharacterized protein n=1 Tax=Didymodactylos carnosus TaxID=1234261 RepID=A0A815L600_9BILA|nr:unnamed protein product [Didymodactylos carnosus]CAF1404765.1 unnamed protein product [Didymodactylos carnosus]CAF3714255.1 unnamed protein product [Didymodactylos carnosus]CAF4296722.1 unnamed protein product [Didymodactylos carnosus]